MATLNELCAAVGGELIGDGDLAISGVSSLESAGAHDLAPVDSNAFAQLARASAAGALLVSPKVTEELAQPRIRVDAPLVALNRVMELLGLVEPDGLAPGVHPTAVVDPTAMVHETAVIGPFAVIGAGARIGARTRIHPHVVIERGVQVGDDCRLEPGAVLHQGCTVGNRCRIGAHAVLSRQGFGFAAGKTGPVHLHHIGRVVIEDGVHLGAGTAVDRARFDETRIGAMTALDNLVQVGHNATIGSLTFVASQAGLAGNAHVGSQCEIGGQVGLANKARVADRCRVGAQSGVMGEHPAGTELFGTPAEERRTAFRMHLALRNLAQRPKKGR